MLPDYASYDEAIGLDWYEVDPNLRFTLDRLLPEPEERGFAEEVVAESLASGDAPSVVAAAIVRAATDAKPKLRYPAGRQARQLRTLRRIVPARAFAARRRSLVLALPGLRPGNNA